MNVKRALDRMMARLGNRTATGLRVSCLEEMTLAQERLEKAPELPWFLESERVVANTQPNEPRLLLPTDFIREVEDFNLEISQDGGVTYQDLSRKPYDQAEVEISRNSEPGLPQLYYMRRNYIILRPTPDAEYFIRFPTYYAKQPEPVDSADSENEWFRNTPNLVMSMAGLVISTTLLKDPELVTFYAGQQKSEEDNLVRLITARQEENRDRRMG